MLILGLNAYHGDAAACLVRDGRLLAAAEEERFRRIKHWAGLPTEAIRYCLSEAGVDLGEVDHLAINRKPGANNWRRLRCLLQHRPDFGLVRNRISNIRAALSLEETLFRAFGASNRRIKVHYVEHHLAHLASAYCIGALTEAVCVSVDGFGDFASTAWGLGRNRSLSIDGRIYFPHSLGIFYSAITQHLGFPHFGDEYKVMGLAAYGEARYLRQMRRIVRVQSDGTFQLALKYFRHHRDDLGYSWNGCAPGVEALYSSDFERLLGPARRSGDSIEPRHYDLAHSAQSMYEEALFALLNALYRKYNCPNLALAGGCAMNSVANGKLTLRTPFKRVFVPPAPGDAGGAVGAALVVRHKLQGQRPASGATIRTPQPVFSHAFTGPQFQDREIRDLLLKRGLLAEEDYTDRCS